DVRMRDEFGDVAAAGSQLPHLDRTIPRNLEYGESAIGRHVLILLSDRLAQDIQLDMTRFFGERLQRDVITPVVMQRVQQSDEIATRRAQSRAGRQIRD